MTLVFLKTTKSLTVPADMVDDVEQYREELIETAVEQDDDLMEAYMEGEEPSIEDIKRCIRKGTRDIAFFPTFCGSAFKNKGMQLILDAVVDYLPAPTEVDPQPLMDETAKKLANTLSFLQMKHSKRLHSKSWMTASVL